MFETPRVDEFVKTNKDFGPAITLVNLTELARKLERNNNKLKNALNGVLNSALHPEIAIRASFVQLEPIRKVLKEVDNLQ